MLGGTGLGGERRGAERGWVAARATAAVDSEVAWAVEGSAMVLAMEAPGSAVVGGVRAALARAAMGWEAACAVEGSAVALEKGAVGSEAVWG